MSLGYQSPLLARFQSHFLGLRTVWRLQDAFPVPEVSGVKVWLDAGITIERLAELPNSGGRPLGADQ